MEKIMNRKIKFRVWDEKYNQWDTSPLTINPAESVVKQGLVIQQFTGLKDKNGKEIYEGDIVKFTKWEASKTNTRDYLVAQPKVVKWSLHAGGDYPFAGFTFINYNSSDLEIGCLVNCMNVQHSEVIGNIFENPELCVK